MKSCWISTRLVLRYCRLLSALMLRFVARMLAAVVVRIRVEPISPDLVPYRPIL